MKAFDYPTEPHDRRHGPDGYKNHESYRDWLRDEFVFRCVYCLHREKWYGRQGTFHVDHLVPVDTNPCGRCQYTNLVYACATCNTAKSNILSIPDPCEVAFGNCLRVTDRGEIEPLNDEGRRLCDVLRLNSQTNVKHRLRWMQAFAAFKESRPDLYRQYMGFPDNLPDLRQPRRRVPRNTRPEGAHNCFFVLRKRGELPETY